MCKVNKEAFATGTKWDISTLRWRGELLSNGGNTCKIIGAGTCSEGLSKAIWSIGRMRRANDEQSHRTFGARVHIIVYDCFHQRH